MSRVLVTGAAGCIGRIVVRALAARGHAVHGFDRDPLPEGLPVERGTVGDLADGAAVHDAAAGMDAVVHLGAYPNPADFVDVLLGPNVIGLYHVLEACRAQHVARVVLASSAQAVSGHDWEAQVRVEDGPAPMNWYAMTKVWAEQAGAMYARRWGLSVLSVRIVWLPRDSDDAARLAAHRYGVDQYLSHDDAGRFFVRCVESDTPAPGESAVLFAASLPQGRSIMDMTPARDVIGYEPRDRFPAGLPFDVPV